MVTVLQQPNMWHEPIEVQRGDVWQLGRHRLACADSTNAENVARLMQGVQADACITDPPYPREFASLYGNIASYLPNILKTGGSFLAIVPHYLMSEVLADVKKHLKYRWIISMWQGNGSHPRMAMGIEVMWKPIVWWVNGSWPHGRGFIRDGFDNTPPNKHYHEWEQSLSWAEYCLKFVPSSGIVFEPCLGGGTLLEACEKSDYTCYAMEIDPIACEQSIQRWQEHTGHNIQRICKVRE